MRLAVLAFALLAASAAQAREYSRLVVFGDSYSDSGASHAISNRLVEEGVPGAELVPGPQFWEGRWSNGPTAVEVLASHLNLELENHAVGGALSGEGNANPALDTFSDTGMLGQIRTFMKGHEHLDPEALYVLYASANDFLVVPSWPSEQTVRSAADRAVANQLQAIDELERKGATHVLLVGPIDLSRIPMVIQAGHAQEAALFRDRVNGALNRALEERGDRTILYFDSVAFSVPIMASPGRYGFNNVTQACIGRTPAGENVICRQPDTHYFYDEVHPTARVHQLTGEALAEAVRGWRR